METTIHHALIPHTRNHHGYDTFHDQNFKELDSKISHRVSNLYKNKTPLEELALFYLINEQVLRNDVRDEIRDLSLLDRDEFFTPEILTAPTEYDIRRFVDYIENGKQIFIDGNGIQPRKRERDEHHIIPRSRKSDGFETRKGPNSFRNIGRQFHSRWHTLYNNRHPLEILALDFERNASLYSEEVRNRIQEIITLPQDVFYDDNLLAPENEKKLAIF